MIQSIETGQKLTLRTDPNYSAFEKDFPWNVFADIVWNEVKIPEKCCLQMSLEAGFMLRYKERISMF